MSVDASPERSQAPIDIPVLLARCTFPPATSAVTCAVSGGPDSTALLALAVAAGCSVTAVHVDHALRAPSGEEAEVVARSAMRVGAAFRSVTVEIGDGPNLEARARAARSAVLPADVMTGHTADDQAETILINLLRGAGLAGLAGMRPGPLHPILGLRRSETAEVCRALDLEVIHDPSNSDPRHLRNRVRHELLPMLEDLARRDLVPILARQADLLRADVDELDHAADALEPTDARAIASAPLALARRAVRRWLTREHPPDAATVERVLTVARGGSLACEIGGGRRVERRQQRLRVIESGVDGAAISPGDHRTGATASE